jgi:hypothetical protein
MLKRVLVLPVSHALVDTMTRPVMVQTTMVSMNGPSMAINPCLTLCSVFAVVYAMGALPRPASLEKTPLAIPNRMV